LHNLSLLFPPQPLWSASLKLTLTTTPPHHDGLTKKKLISSKNKHGKSLLRTIKKIAKEPTRHHSNGNPEIGFDFRLTRNSVQDQRRSIIIIESMARA
jgi:hypothetical protein